MDNPDNHHNLKFGYSTKTRTLQKVSQKLEQSFYSLLTVLGTASFTYAGGFASGAKSLFSLDNESAWHQIQFFSGYTWILEGLWVVLSYPYFHFVYACIFLYFGMSGTSKDYENLSNRNKNLEDKLSDQQNIREVVTSSQEEIARLNGMLREKHQELVTTWLKGTFAYLMNNDDAVVKENTHARVSIYYAYNNHFYLLARYSPNAEYNQIHRQKFAMGRGIIYKAYQHLEVHENSLTEYNSSEPDKYYTTIEEKYPLKREQLENFNMKSCRYFGRAIREADVTQGVILIESTKECDLCKKQVQLIREHFEKNWSHLNQFVRHGIEHDINSNYHEEMKTDIDFLDNLDQRPAPELDVLDSLVPTPEVSQ